MQDNLRQQSDWQLYKRLLSYLRPYIPLFIISILGFATFAVASPFLAHIMGMIEVSVNRPEPVESDRIMIPLLLLGAFALRGVGTFFGNYYLAVVARNIVHKMRCDLVDHYTRLPIAFFDHQQPGHLVSKVSYNTEQVTGAATGALTVMIREGLTVIALFSFLIYLNWMLTCVFLAIGPLIGFVVSAAGRYFRRYSKRIQTSMGDVTHILTEIFSGNKVIRTFQGQEYELKRFTKASQYNRKQSLKLSATQALSTPVIQLIVALAMGFLVWLALDPLFFHSLGDGNFFAYLTAASLIIKPIRQLSEVHAVIQKGLAGAQTVFEELDAPLEEDSGTESIQQVKQGIEFDSVNFEYKLGEPALHDINLSVKAGEMIAIVGSSGSGKSTLVSLLPRFYQLNQGRILIDGINISDLKLENLRSLIAIVSQDITLFNDTVRKNLAYGTLSSKKESELLRTLDQANAREFIDQLPNGLDTVIGDNGSLLSGGQRQRLVIARALLKDSPILILDEATSALDTKSEKLIQQAIEKVTQDRTTFVIAHRLSTVIGADRIVVLDNGKIVESGSHEQLLELNGSYSQLYKIQFANKD